MDVTHDYDDIININYEKNVRPTFAGDQKSSDTRIALLAPFAALTGFEKMIDTEYTREELQSTFEYIDVNQNIFTNQAFTIRRKTPASKTGARYKDLTINFLSIDMKNETLTCTDGEVINLSDILNINGKMLVTTSDDEMDFFSENESD